MCMYMYQHMYDTDLQTQLGELFGILRQYSYFGTSKASNLSTCCLIRRFPRSACSALAQQKGPICNANHWGSARASR